MARKEHDRPDPTLIISGSCRPQPSKRGLGMDYPMTPLEELNERHHQGKVILVHSINPLMLQDDEAMQDIRNEDGKCYGRPIIFLLFPLFSPFLFLFPSRAANPGYGHAFLPFSCFYSHLVPPFLAMDTCFPLFYSWLWTVPRSILSSPLFSLSDLRICPRAIFSLFYNFHLVTLQFLPHVTDAYALVYASLLIIYHLLLIVRKSTQPLGHSI
jgi:hypothetical protein